MDTGSAETTASAIAGIRDRLESADPARSALTSAIQSARHGDPEFAIDDVSQSLRYFGVSLLQGEYQALRAIAEEFSMEDCLEGLHVIPPSEGPQPA